MTKITKLEEIKVGTFIFFCGSDYPKKYSIGVIAGTTIVNNLKEHFCLTKNDGVMKNIYVEDIWSGARLSKVFNDYLSGFSFFKSKLSINKFKYYMKLFYGVDNNAKNT